MTVAGVHHVTIDVEGVRDAEAYYRKLFDMSVLFREGELAGEYGKVPDGVMWAEAAASGVEPAMSFLNRDAFTLALAQAEAVTDGGALDHVALAVSESFVDTVAENASDVDCAVDDRGDVLYVEDRYGVEWELNTGTPPPTCPFDDLDL